MFHYKRYTHRQLLTDSIVVNATQPYPFHASFAKQLNPPMRKAAVRMRTKVLTTDFLSLDLSSDRPLAFQPVFGTANGICSSNVLTKSTGIPGFNLRPLNGVTTSSFSGFGRVLTSYSTA